MANDGGKIIAGLLFAGCAAVIGWDIINNAQTVNTIMDTPNNQGGNGPTVGLIPTAGGGVNNPLDLRTSSIPWQGKITPPGSAFEQFQNMWQGYRAGIDTIKAHYNNDGQTTLNLFFAGNSNPGFAPAADGNDPVAYAAKVAAAMGITPDDDFGPYLNALGLSAMLPAMAMQEQGSKFVVNPIDITMALSNLGIS